MPTITGICENRSHALVVVDALRRAGYVRPAPQIIVDDPDAVRSAVPASLRELLVGTTAGTCLGGVAGGVAGWLADPAETALAAATAVAVLEAVDPALAAGAAVGAMTGALLGTHAGGSVAVYAADDYAHQLARGAALVRVDAPQRCRARRAVQILRAYGVRAIRCGVVG